MKIKTIFMLKNGQRVIKENYEPVDFTTRLFLSGVQFKFKYFGALFSDKNLVGVYYVQDVN